jgi:hypothetical protein
MKKIHLLLLSIFILSLISCKPATDNNVLLNTLMHEIESGRLNSAIDIAGLLKKTSKQNSYVYRKADSLSQIAERINLDFSIPEDQVISQIEKRSGPFTLKDKTGWEEKGWLEYKVINSNKMYFNRAASNLMLIRKFYEDKEERLKEISGDPAMVFRLGHTEKIYNASERKADPVVPVIMKINYTITVHPDAVPEGEVIRCWLPWPRKDNIRQKDIELLSTSEPEYKISPDSSVHSTIYLEKTARKGEPTIFKVSLNYQSSGQYFNPGQIITLPYIKTSELYRKYTAEQLPQISFTPHIRRLADSITSEGDSPYVLMKKIYTWFKENIPWTGALEYSIMPDIPEYVYTNRRGDCGMQTFLFISMLRYKGIPARWQSGWMVPPGYENLHDWCEVYFEGTGWVPVDISYDLQNSENKAIREFYMSGLDSYRFIVNDGVAGALHPAKQFMRSEPFDFQRGEVEWKKGNLYFDKWDYDMKIEYLK